MEQNQKQTNGESLLRFDPIVVLLDVLKRWLIILVAALTVGVGTYILSDITYTPVYKASTTFVVTERSSSSTVYSTLSTTNTLAGVISELMNSSILRKAILQEIGATSFDGSISAAIISETNLINVTVSASDPETAFRVAHAIIDHHGVVTYEVIDSITMDVLQYPAFPSGPSNPANALGNMKKMMVLGAGAAILLLAYISFSRNSVRSENEAVSKLNCRFLGEIPHENKHKTVLSHFSRRKTSILITNPTTGFRFVETIRKLRHRIEKLMHRKKVLMVTSLLENEGKSTVAVNLALALARKGQKVLLIDCDLRKPACRALMEQVNVKYGLRQVLSGQATLMEALIQDRKSGLSMLLETKGTQNSGDLISSEQMQALLERVRNEFDYVILDTPPMAAVSDAEAMTAYADASLIVVRQNVALAPAVNKAVAALNSGKATLLGCVLNNVYATHLSSGSSYGYGYGRYGHYGHYGAYHSNKSK